MEHLLNVPNVPRSVPSISQSPTSSVGSNPQSKISQVKGDVKTPSAQEFGRWLPAGIHNITLDGSEV